MFDFLPETNVLYLFGLTWVLLMWIFREEITPQTLENMKRLAKKEKALSEKLRRLMKRYEKIPRYSDFQKASKKQKKVITQALEAVDEELDKLKLESKIIQWEIFWVNRGHFKSELILTFGSICLGCGYFLWP